LKRWFLATFFGFKLHPTARIGFSWVYPKRLEMGKNSRIDHLVVAVHLDQMVLGESATVGRRTWITGFPRGDQRHFGHQTDRDPSLVMGEHSAITKNHHIDCTSRVTIGRFSTIGGYYSQLLSHSIDILANRQDSAPITIGEYCFVGTGVIILGGANLPDRSVLGAGALLNDALKEPGFLHAGVPARPIHRIPEDAGYFHRKTGKVQ
ncbi:MAG TPA: hypothetical protein VK968_14835, partial [Roseimicrobium sp.]|nr:hypothetical protein [Roseimicrobium sp.]